MLCLKEIIIIENSMLYVDHKAISVDKIVYLLDIIENIVTLCNHTNKI